MPSAVRDGTFFTVTPRPPNRFAEPGQELHRRDAAGQREIELRILRPERMLGGDFGGVRARHLVAVLQRLDAGRRVDAEMRVRVDDARRHPLAARVDHERVGRRVHRLADRRDLAVLQQDRSALDDGPAAVRIVALRMTVVREGNGL